jgi:hypothetical protein
MKDIDRMAALLVLILDSCLHIDVEKRQQIYEDVMKQFAEFPSLSLFFSSVQEILDRE